MGILNMKPDFRAMNKLDLRAYVLAHRDDEDAFHAYMDKIRSDDRRINHPATESLEHISNYPDFNRNNTNN
jgi:hypothetical protein